MASYRCPDGMCGVVMDAEDEGQTELCPRCDLEMEEFFPEITECDIPTEQSIEDSSPLARAITSKFRS